MCDSVKGEHLALFFLFLFLRGEGKRLGGISFQQYFMGRAELQGGGGGWGGVISEQILL